jgi:hypothetical protein
MAYQGGNFTGRNKAPFPLNVRAVPSCTCMVRALGLSLFRRFYWIEIISSLVINFNFSNGRLASG